MGTVFFGHCETCCGKDNNDLESDSNPIILGKSNILSPDNQNPNLKKILIASSSTNFNLKTNSAISERTDLSISFENSPINTYKNEILILQSNLINFPIYDKMIKGERLHNILEPLTSYSNNILFELLLSILTKIKEVFKEAFFDENSVIDLYHKYIGIFQELKNKNIFEDIKINIEEESRIKFNLLDIIESVVELFHFFKFKILNDQEPYNKCYWEKYKNYINYMEQKMNEIKNGIININLSLGDNKLKIIE